MRISDWSSDVCSSDLLHRADRGRSFRAPALLRARREDANAGLRQRPAAERDGRQPRAQDGRRLARLQRRRLRALRAVEGNARREGPELPRLTWRPGLWLLPAQRSEEHTSELQSLMRSSYAVFCLKKNKKKPKE